MELSKKGDYYKVTLPYDKYNREEFIKFWCLTSEEFFLLPKKERIAFAALIYSSLVSKVPNIKDSYYGHGYIDNFRYKEYFEESGISVLNYDFGFEMFEIKRITLSKVVVEENTQLDLIRHITLITTAKADAFEYILLNYYPNLREKISKLETIDLDSEAPYVKPIYAHIIDGLYYFNNWPKKVRQNIIEVSLTAVREALEKEEVVRIPSNRFYNELLNNSYINSSQEKTTLELKKKK